MRQAELLSFILALALAAGTARAQEQPTAEQAVARVIHAALAPTGYGDWRYRWDAVSIRISSMMHWHLSGPDEPGDETLIRRGWVSAGGRQVGVSAYGEGATVSSLGFEMNGWRFNESDPDALLAALALHGVEAVETARRDAPEVLHTDAPMIVYRLTAPERDTGSLTRTISCTSPLSAAARQCSVSYELALGG